MSFGANDSNTYCSLLARRYLKSTGKFAGLIYFPVWPRLMLIGGVMLETGRTSGKLRLQSLVSCVAWLKFVIADVPETL